MFYSRSKVFEFIILKTNPMCRQSMLTAFVASIERRGPQKITVE